MSASSTQVRSRSRRFRLIERKPLVFSALVVSALGTCTAAQADWFYRGTTNAWDAKPMTHLGGSLYETCETFANGDSNGGPRFKIDRFGDWQENYPTADRGVGGNTAYKIQFDSSSKNITTQAVSQCDSTITEWYFRGTPNGWADNILMTESGDDFCTTQDFNGQTNPRFKVDRFGNWQEAYPNEDWQITILDSGVFDICIDPNTTLIAVSEQTGSGLDYTVLGAEYTPQSTTFTVWSPDTANVKLWLDGTLHPLAKAPNRHGYTDVYGIKVDGDWRNKTYNFQVNDVTVRDPYGKMAVPNTDLNVVMDMSRTEPEGGWAPRPVLAEREDAIIYEVHIRDFTIDSSSGVETANRGKFLGMVEAGTTFNGKATGLDHLKELGINHVQILPMYDFGSCPDVSDTACYNWGYDPRNYNVPEERYNTSLDYEDRVRELKTMVNEFHKAGIRVIMDVVYNHTWDKEVFENISPQYYLDHDLTGCCANTLDGGLPMVGRMIEDSMLYWMNEYNIDGFRFDLMGVFNYWDIGDWAQAVHDQYPNDNILIYGEPWVGAPDGNANHLRQGNVGRLANNHVGVFNDQIRNGIKGDGNTANGGGFAFNQDPGNAFWKTEMGIRGAIRATYDLNSNVNEFDAMFANDPEQSINYVSAHDNLALRDKILEWAHENGQSHNDGYLKRIQQYANGIVLTSQGIPFIHAGAELLREKDGIHDSYKSPDSVNKIQWQWKTDHADIFDYYKDVIALRKAHKGFRFNTWHEVEDNVVTTRNGSVIEARINAQANGDSAQTLLVIYNSGGDISNYSLPSGNWTVVMEDSNPGLPDRVVNGSVSVKGTAVTVLTQ